MFAMEYEFKMKFIQERSRRKIVSKIFTFA